MYTQDFSCNIVNEIQAFMYMYVYRYSDVSTYHLYMYKVTVLSEGDIVVNNIRVNAIESRPSKYKTSLSVKQKRTKKFAQ